MMKFNPFVAAGIFVFVLLCPRPTLAQSCPNVVTYGEHPPAARAEGEFRRVRLTGVYFRTSDRSAFIPEEADRTRSRGFAKVRSDEFLNRLKELGQKNEARVNSELTGSVLLGDNAELNLEQHSLGLRRDFGDLSFAPLDPRRWFGLDRHTTVNVQMREGETFYRVLLLSSFVSVKPEGAQLTLDLDSGMFVRPGETVIYKLFSDYEVARSGDERTHLALTVSPY